MPCARIDPDPRAAHGGADRGERGGAGGADRIRRGNGDPDSYRDGHGYANSHGGRDGNADPG
jgi:hypothetical protein